MASSKPEPRDHVDAILAQWRRERPHVDVAPMGVVGRVKRVARLFERATAENFARHDLEPWEFDVLASLLRSGAPHRISAGALGRAMMITSGSITNRIDGLEKRQLVRRVDDPADRRAVLVELTAKGMRCVDAVLASHLEVERGVLSALDAKEQRQLAGLLRSLLTALEE